LHAFGKLEDAIYTGTNLMDLMIIYIGESEDSIET